MDEAIYKLVDELAERHSIASEAIDTADEKLIDAMHALAHLKAELHLREEDKDDG